MGMIANVLRQVSTQHADGTATMQDCTNKGWSSRFNQVCVVNVEGPFEPSADCPAVVLRRHPSPSINAVHVVSEEDNVSGRWAMAGGNYLHTSDSRFGRKVRELLNYDEKQFPGPVSIHDRIEG